MARRRQSKFNNVILYYIFTSIFTAFFVCTYCTVDTDTLFLWSRDDDPEDDELHYKPKQAGCCYIPEDGQPGDCVRILDCESIATFLNHTPKPLSQHTVKVLQRYQCGHGERYPMVCCPYGPFPFGKNGNGNINTNAPPPPNVSRHRNIKLLPSDCGHVAKLDIDDKMTHRQEASLFQFPWMALLSYYRTKRGPQFQCVGTIVNDRYILTSAHCLTNFKSLLLGVRIGEHDIRTRIDCEVRIDGKKVCGPPVQDLRIEEIIPHPQFKTCSKLHDIGLIRLQDRMNLSVETARPVCLPLDDMLSYDKRNATVTGWALSQDNQVLVQGEHTAISNKECGRIYRKAVPIASSQLCGLNNGKAPNFCFKGGSSVHVVGTGNGESKIVQQGVLSFGPKLCGFDGFPEVYTRTAYYMDWILDNMRA